MKKTTFSIASLLLLSTLIFGCASAPTQELETAKAALTSADDAEADLYVVDLYRAAQDSLAAAEAEIELQNGEFPLSRNYDRAKALLSFVEQTAQSAASQVEEVKMTMTTETQTYITQAQEAIAKANELITKAPQGKDGRIALAAISEETTSTEAMLTEAQTLLANGEIAQAHSLAQSVVEKANALVLELETAISKKASS